jgi:hypothetical protein
LVQRRQRSRTTIHTAVGCITGPDAPPAITAAITATAEGAAATAISRGPTSQSDTHTATPVRTGLVGRQRP